MNTIIHFFLKNRLITFLLITAILFIGTVTSPFPWDQNIIPRNPVAVDAIPNIGENQQIVFTQWKGRSPQDVQDQVTYPLTTQLLGISGVKSIRSSSMFGFSSIYVIFEDDVDFYGSRTRILEKISALPNDLLPDKVQPKLGPDATALGQVFWYTIEGRDKKGQPAGGWDLQEIRSVQDFYVKNALTAAGGVAEVASIGGFVKEFQIDLKPNYLKKYDISLSQVAKAVTASNQDVGANTVEINQAEYFVRGIGQVEELADLRKTVVKYQDDQPIYLHQIARMKMGPADRRGVLDKGGAEVVGGVVVARYGENPMEVIQNVKAKIRQIETGLPQKELGDGRVSQLKIIPFYDRSNLIKETIGTLEHALVLQLLITVLVILLLMLNIRMSALVALVLPLAVMMVFGMMKLFDVIANVVALSGIAIAIGTMVDLGIIVTENIQNKIEERQSIKALFQAVFQGIKEVSTAVLTAVLTTVISFLPVFLLEGQEGKLFAPLAFTKTAALLASLIVALFILPTLAYWLFGLKVQRTSLKKGISGLLVLLAFVLIGYGHFLSGILLLLFAGCQILQLYTNRWQITQNGILRYVTNNAQALLIILAVFWLLANYWLPLGAQASAFENLVFSAIIIGFIFLIFFGLKFYYASLLHWCFRLKYLIFLPVFILLLAVLVWLGFPVVFGFVASGFKSIDINVEETKTWQSLADTFPGLGKEFMPDLDEGTFLLMPSTLPHAGMEFNQKKLRQLDMLVSSIPEVEMTVGKLGRVESSLDPAPTSMFENIVQYKPEFMLDDNGRRLRFKTDDEGHFIKTDEKSISQQEAILQDVKAEDLIPADNGKYFRNWRSHIQSKDDIWEAIRNKLNIPGLTSASELQPIETRLIMLQTGMRAPLGIKVFGPDLESIEQFSVRLETALKNVSAIRTPTVFSDRVMGKPYLNLDIDRNKIARYGLRIADVQNVIETAIGGKEVSQVIQGRERYGIRLRYPRSLRNHPKDIENMLVSTPDGQHYPLKQFVNIRYESGPRSIKSENTFPVNYVFFDHSRNASPVEAVQQAKNQIERQIERGDIQVPQGVNYEFSGQYENQVRSEKRLSLIVPIVLVVVFLILYLQFRSVGTTLMVFSSIIIALSGGFILLGLFGASWFMDFELFGRSMQGLFSIQPTNLSVAVWVGFIALFGIATDDGVLMATYLDQEFKKERPKNIAAVREKVLKAAQKRLRPAVMTTVTTLIALLPILSSNGKGSAIMNPMAIPIFGGMLLATISYLIIPMLYAWRAEHQLKKHGS